MDEFHTQIDGNGNGKNPNLTRMASETNPIQSFGISHMGRVRDENEDSWFTATRGKRFIAVVADGMGGHEAGKFASETAVHILKECFSSPGTEHTLTEEIIENGLFTAHKEILRLASESGQKEVMGTTCSVAVLEPESTSSSDKNSHARLVMGHIGDSRIYRLNTRTIEQLTTDHSMLQRMLDAGLLDPRDANQFPLRNVLYRSLGGMEELTVDESMEASLASGEVLVLCSDGLTGHVTSDEIHRVLRGTKNISAAGTCLVDLANQRGGSDNITVVLIEYGHFCRPGRRERQKELSPLRCRFESSAAQWNRRRRAWIISLLLLLSILCALLAVTLIRTTGKSRMPESQVESPDSVEQNFHNKASKIQPSQEEL